MEYMNTKDIGEMLGYTSETIRKMAESGQFDDAHRQPGGQWRIPKSSAQRYLNKLRDSVRPVKRAKSAS